MGDTRDPIRRVLEALGDAAEPPPPFDRLSRGGSGRRRLVIIRPLAAAAAFLMLIGGVLWLQRTDSAAERVVSSSRDELAPTVEGDLQPGDYPVEVEPIDLGQLAVSSTPLRPALNGWREHILSLTNEGAETIYVDDTRSGQLLAEGALLVSDEGCGYGRANAGGPIVPGLCEQYYRSIEIAPGESIDLRVTAQRDLPGMAPLNSTTVNWNRPIRWDVAPFQAGESRHGTDGHVSITYAFEPLNGTEVLVTAITERRPVALGLATNQPALEQLWSSINTEASVPVVALDERFVVSITTDSGGCGLALDRLRRSESALEIDFVELPPLNVGPRSGCAQPLVTQTFLVAIPYTDLGAATELILPASGPETSVQRLELPQDHSDDNTATTPADRDDPAGAPSNAPGSPGNSTDADGSAEGGCGPLGDLVYEGDDWQLFRSNSPLAAWTVYLNGEQAGTACAVETTLGPTDVQLYTWGITRVDDRLFVYGELPPTTGDLTISGEPTDTFTSMVDGQPFRAFAVELPSGSRTELLAVSSDLLLTRTGDPEIPVGVPLEDGTISTTYQFTSR